MGLHEPLGAGVHDRFGTKSEVQPLETHVRSTSKKQTSVGRIGMSGKCQEADFVAEWRVTH